MAVSLRRATRRFASGLGLMLGAALLMGLAFLANPRNALAEEGVTRIHVLSFLNAGDAIVIESNGRFGMVDSGESSDYPDGSDPRYPFRPGTTIGQGVEEEVISYLDSLGVTEDNFDFYIGTHPHSDHIGNAGMIIRKYKPSKVFTPRYDDSYMTSSWGLWDNQYVYDKLVSAADEVGAELYLDFDENAPEDSEPGSHVCRPEFDFGCSHIELVNVDSSYETEGTSDANHISLGVKVSCNDKVAYLAGDICNTDGDEDRLAQTLGHVDFMKLGHHGVNEANTYGYVMALSPDIVYQTGGYEWLWDQPLKAVQDLGCLFYNSEELSNAGISAFVVEFDSDGPKTNMGPTGLSIIHNHYTGCYEAFESNRAAYNLNDWYSVENGYAYFDKGPQSMRNAWISQRAGHSYVGDNALRVSGWQYINGSWYHFTDDGIMQIGWVFVDGQWYWFDGSGAMVAGLVSVGGTYSLFSSSGAWLGYASLHSGWNLIEGDWYYISNDGQVETGWLKLGNTWYWLDGSGKMATGWKLLGDSYYFFDSSGAMATGWRYVGSQWYWLDSSGYMRTGWQFVDGNWYYLDVANGAMVTGWLHDGDDWYFLSVDGAMQRSRWVGNYYVLGDGTMAKNQWIGSYYVGNDGLWIA